MLFYLIFFVNYFLQLFSHAFRTKRYERSLANTTLCLDTAVAWLQRTAIAQAVAVKAVGGKEGGQVIAGL